MHAGWEINITLTGNAPVTPAYINIPGPRRPWSGRWSWYLPTNGLNSSISFVKDVTVIKWVVKSIPPLTPLTFASTKDLHLSVEKLQAGAQQLLLSLGKHPLFVFFFGKYGMLYKYMEMARTWGLALTAPNTAQPTDSCCLHQSGHFCLDFGKKAWPHAKPPVFLSKILKHNSSVQLEFPPVYVELQNLCGVK